MMILKFLRSIFKNINTYIILGIVFLIISVIFLGKSLLDAQAENRKLTYNVEALATNFGEKIEKVRLENGELLNKINGLTVNSNDLKNLNSELNTRLKRLNIKVNRLQSVTDVGINYKINIDSIASKRIVNLLRDSVPKSSVTQLKPTDDVDIFRFKKSDDYMNLAGNINVSKRKLFAPYISKFQLKTKDSILIAPKVEYKRLWWTLWIAKRPVGLKVNVKSESPYSNIEYIKHYNFKELK